MNMKAKDILHKGQMLLTVSLILLPLSVLLLANGAPAYLWMAAGYAAAFLLLGMVCVLLPGRFRIPAGVLGALALSAMALILPVKENAVVLLLPVMHIAALFLILPMGGWGPTKELNGFFPMMGMGAYLFAQLLFFFNQRMGKNTYDGLQWPLTGCFLVFGALTLLSMNRSSMDRATQSRRRAPRLMRRQNIVLTLALALIGIGIAAIPAITTWLEKIWAWMGDAIARLAKLFADLLSGGSKGSGGGMGEAGESFAEVGGASQPSYFSELMEKIFIVLGLVVLLIALAFAFRIIGRKLWQILRALWLRLNRYGSAATEDYEDEITDTRDEPDTDRKGVKNRLRRFVQEDTTGTPNQRIRSRYRRLMHSHEWASSSTARETLPQDAAQLYEQARYSGKALPPEEAERFLKETKNI